MFCDQCGNQIPDGVKFCPVCGAAQLTQQAAPTPAPQPVQQPQYTAEPQYSAQPQYTAEPQYNAQPITQQNEYNAVPEYLLPKKKSHAGIVIIILIIFLILIGGAVAAYFVLPSPAKAAENFLQGFVDGDWDQVVDNMDSKTGRQMKAALDLLGEDAEDYLSDYSLDGVDFSDITVEYDGADGNVVMDVFNKFFAKEASVIVVVEFLGEEEEVEIDMVNEGLGNWKVDAESVFGDVF